MFGKDVHLYPLLGEFYPLLEFTSKRYHILVFLCLFYVTLYDRPYVLPCCWAWRDVTLFLAERYCCVCTPPVYPSPVLAHSGFFRVLALVHGAAMNIGMHLSFKIMVFSGSAPRNEIAGS